MFNISKASSEYVKTLHLDVEKIRNLSEKIDHQLDNFEKFQIRVPIASIFPNLSTPNNTPQRDKKRTKKFLRTLPWSTIFQKKKKNSKLFRPNYGTKDRTTPSPVKVSRKPNFLATSFPLPKIPSEFSANQRETTPERNQRTPHLHRARKSRGNSFPSSSLVKFTRCRVDENKKKGRKKRKNRSIPCFRVAFSAIKMDPGGRDDVRSRGNIRWWVYAR